MERLTFKDYVWDRNPTTYKEEYIREPRYSTSEGVTSFDGMGGMQRIITGTGVFLGNRALLNFEMLTTLFAEKTPGNLVHPLWGTRYCYFTGLELTQEPREDYISYRFTFTGALANGNIPV